ncbi:hypothetical protein C4A76_23810 [Brevibacillus laterosporus]|uniref:DUF1643 domain-containing protein n=1 Tax=Brevibacillus laterosporus TaxID=1465 RepID=UPI000CE3A3ED|nr:DUF1643 domain-containing protein [Brevibacillus laterosporus]PPA81290.1 hypothetical protein C4A76_23810 [Brevibacillus laterosporus]
MKRKSLLNGVLVAPYGKDVSTFQEELIAWIEECGGQFEPLFRENNQQNVIYKSAFHSTILSKEEDKRFFLRKVWEPFKHEAGVIMMNPSRSTHLLSDGTVDFLIEYLSQAKPELDYGSLTVVNLSPVIKGSNAGENERDFPPDDESNNAFILEMIKNAKIIILGWGMMGQLKGIPNLSPEVVIALHKARTKLRVFSLKKTRKNSRDIWYVAHPKPQGGPDRGFGLSHKLEKLTDDQLNLLLNEN